MKSEVPKLKFGQASGLWLTPLRGDPRAQQWVVYGLKYLLLSYLDPRLASPTF